MLRTILSFDDRRDRRALERVTVALPASISLGSQSYTAKLMNIMREGAMFEMSVPLLSGTRVVVNCGSISAEAVVVWNKGNLLGVSFKEGIAEDRVREQVSRCAALHARRERGGTEQRS